MFSGPDRLREWIARSNFNQRQAAEILELDPVHLSQILNRQRKPGLATAVKIEHRTGVSVESWLLNAVSSAESDESVTTDKPKIAKR